ncbi:hypothetical protein [Halopseudomonas pelagia]|uniref:hypothetical protein n=1 Tax=Halopseudomonas pelagia TaxID=553151 RepID=UPI001C548EE2|nr:hypothetical protein [Halopseudomonas pelagia]
MELVDRLFIKRETQKPGFNRRMFDEDFSRMFHVTNQRDNLFEFVSNDDELTQKLLGNVNTRYTQRSPDKTVHDLVEEIARSLVSSGRAYYFLHDDPAHQEMHIVPFSPRGVVRFFGIYIQWIPKRMEMHWDREDEEIPREIRVLDASKVMRLDMPTSIKRMLSAQNKTLDTLDKHQFEVSNFPPPATHANPNPTNQFDFRVWRDIQERALYRATRRTGWRGRKSDSSKCSDFFSCHRLIRFRRNQLLLRNNILKQLSGELSRIGKSCKADFSVDISATDNLSSVAHLDELEMRLASETARFNEVIDYCYGR